MNEPAEDGLGRYPERASTVEKRRKAQTGSPEASTDTLPRATKASLGKRKPLPTAERIRLLLRTPN